MAVDWGLVVGVASLVLVPPAIGVSVAMAAKTAGEFKFARVCIVATALLTLGSFYWLTSEFPLDSRKVIITAILGAVVAVSALYGIDWIYRRQAKELGTRTTDPMPQAGISDEEKFRRTVLLNDLRQQYIAVNNINSPELQAGLENPPPSWINQRLNDLNEKWRMPTTIRTSADPGLFVECHLIKLPFKVPPEGRYFALNLFPTPLVNGGGGLAQYSGQPNSDVDLGPEILFAYKCQVTNYGPKPVVAVTIGLNLLFQEAIKDKDNPNVLRSGNVSAQRPWRIDIGKIDPGTSNPFVFYIWNVTPSFARVSFPDSAVAEYIGDSERFRFRVTSSNSIPLNLGPIGERGLITRP